MGRTRGGSGAKNGRDSNPKHLGVKCYGGTTVTAGSNSAELNFIRETMSAKRVTTAFLLRQTAMSFSMKE